MTQTTDRTAGAQLLDDLSNRADALADAIEDFGGDDLLAQATDLANRVAIAKAVLGPCLADAPEPLKVRAIDWNWKRLDETCEGDVVWHEVTQEWTEVEHAQHDLSLAGETVRVHLFLADRGEFAGKPSDVVRVADQALALAVDAAIDDLHERDTFDAEAV